MPALALKQIEQQENSSFLQARLRQETAEVKNAHKAKVIEFMVSEGIKKIAALDYPARLKFEKWLGDKTTASSLRHYILAFDKIKQYSVRKEIHIMADGKTVRPNYENTILFLPYHPDLNIAAMFRKSTKKNELAWDFTRKAPEQMKRQVFDILHYALENNTSF